MTVFSFITQVLMIAKKNEKIYMRILNRETATTTIRYAEFQIHV